MANILVKDGDGNEKYLKATGAGSDADPFIASHALPAEAVLIGAVAETAPATDTASSGLNGRLQRIAQRLTSLIALLPAALGQAAMAASLPVAIASNQSAVPTQDAGPNWTSSLGVSGAAVTSANLTALTAVTDAPTGGQKLVIDDLIFSTDTAMSITFTEETSGTVLLRVFLPAVGQVTPRGKLKLATADKKLMAQASVSGNVAITLIYHSEA